MKVLFPMINKAWIKLCKDLEDGYRKIAYGERKNMKELEDIIQDLFKKIP